ncbi:MAG TPA: hypothetical protein VF408_10115 [Sediminibacterium sp.]|jgi:hypothetical protein
MNGFTRDLLVISSSAHVDPVAFDRQLDMLNEMLYHVENWRTFCIANELIHIHRHKIIHKPHLIQAILQEKNQKGFVFVCSKN